MKYVLTSSDVFRCNGCGKTFAYRENLNSHVRSQHSNEFFLCSECGRTFKYRKNLNAHVRSQHLNEFFECAHCPFRSGVKRNLQRHVFTHHVGQPRPKASERVRKKKVYSKNVQEYIEEGNMLIHIQQKFECTACKKLFTQKGNLARHMTFHHGQDVKDRLYVYKCAHCSKAWRDKSDLGRHVQTCRSRLLPDHSSKEKLFTCLVQECEAVLNSQYLIKKHYEEVHDISFQYESLEFESRKKFKEWQIDLQRNAACQFFVLKVWKSSTCRNWKMVCHRTGLQPTENLNRKRRKKLSGSKKLNGFCPAEIILSENIKDKTCCITIQKTHVGHANNCNEKNDIASKLAQYKCGLKFDEDILFGTERFTENRNNNDDEDGSIDHIQAVDNNEEESVEQVEQLKNELHNLIDNINDQEKLDSFKKYVLCSTRPAPFTEKPKQKGKTE